MRRRFMTCVMAALMVLVMTACGTKDLPEETPKETATEAVTTPAPETSLEETVTTAESETSLEETEEPVGIANPWSDCGSLAEAEQIAGFSFQFGEAAYTGTLHAKTYRAMTGMIDVGYAAEGEDTCSLTIRQAPKSDTDISGDETQYSHDFTISDAGVEEVRCRGSKDDLMVCSFDFNENSFVLYPDDLTYNEVFYIIGEMTGVDPEVYTD